MKSRILILLTLAASVLVSTMSLRKRKRIQDNTTVQKGLSDTDEKIKIIFDAWVDPMLSDIRQIVNITAGRTGPENHGVNFAGNALILNGIDFISNFYRYPTDAKIEAWEKQRVELESKIKTMPALTGKEQKRIINLLRREREPRTDAEAAYNFIDDFPPNPYKPLSRVLWSVFRHGHIHLYVPKTIVALGQVYRSSVTWSYKDDRTGLSTSEIETLVRGNWEIARQQFEHLDVKSSVFSVNPQMFFVDFEEALRKFRILLEASNQDSLRDAFSRAFDRWLADIQIRGPFADELIKRINRSARARP